MKNQKVNKYLYFWVIQGDYHQGYGWEDNKDNTAKSYKEARGYLKNYRKNAPEYSYRLIYRRELNPEKVL